MEADRPEDLAEVGRELAPERVVIAPVFPRFGRSLLREIAGARAVSAHLRRIAPDALLLCTMTSTPPSARAGFAK